MNKAMLIGRLTRDPDVRYSQGENPVAVARYKLAVDRRFKVSSDNQDADFINCVSFGKTAEFVGKYFVKGMKMGAVGRIQTGSYTNKEGQRIYTTDVVVEEVEFVESKATSDALRNGNNGVNTNTQNNSDIGDGFMNIPDGIDEELPFL